MVFITIIESLLLLYFGYVVAYTFIFSIADLFYKVPSLTEAPTTYSRFAVVIPSYKKEDVVILSVARKALQQTYPQDLVKIPRIFVRMFLLLFKLKALTRNSFTPHYNVEVNNRKS